MLPLSDAIIPLICGFAPVLSGRVWKCAQALLAGAILLPGKRTVAAALRITGLSSDGFSRISGAILWIRGWLKPTLRRCASLHRRMAVDLRWLDFPVPLSAHQGFERRAQLIAVARALLEQSQQGVTDGHSIYFTCY